MAGKGKPRPEPFFAAGLSAQPRQRQRQGGGRALLNMYDQAAKRKWSSPLRFGKFEIDQYKQSFGSELVGSVTSGNYYFFNCVFNQATSNAGFRLDNCLVDFENCSIFQGNSSNFNMTVIGTGKVNLINCVLNSLNGVNLFMETSANVNIINSVLRTDSVNVLGGENIRILGATTTLVLANCQLLNSLPSGGAIYCLSADVPAEIYIQGTVVASLPTDTNISNQIAGTNIIVSNQTKYC